MKSEDELKADLSQEIKRVSRIIDKAVAAIAKNDIIDIMYFTQTLKSYKL